jgi:hypothetical protein
MGNMQKGGCFAPSGLDNDFIRVPQALLRCSLGCCISPFQGFLAQRSFSIYSTTSTCSTTLNAQSLIPDPLIP